MSEITQQTALEYLRYEPETGFLFWRKKASDKTVIGKRAGWQRSPNGYRQVGLVKEIVYEHRLIWLIVTGAFPEFQIDHRNGLKYDNKFDNLREASGTQNLANIGVKRDNTSGTKNVHWCNTKKRWIVKVKRSGSVHHVGAFSDYGTAVIAADAARLAVHGEFASQLGYERDAAMVGWPMRTMK